MRLQGKVAVITGASRGIGAAIAKRFAAEGASVVLSARADAQVKEVADSITRTGGRALAMLADVRNAAQVEKLVTKTMDAFGKLDIVVNNAGITRFGRSVVDASPETVALFDDIIDTNLRGPWLVVRSAASRMKAAGGGVIIQIGSVHGTLGAPDNSAYAASKGGLDAMTRALAVELAPYNIRINNCNPGAIQTQVFRLGDELEALGETAKTVRLMQAYDEFRRHIQPMRMVGQPDDVAWACVYLASDEARFVTGATLMVDGGLTAVLGEPGRLPAHSLSVVAEYTELTERMEAYVRERTQGT